MAAESQIVELIIGVGILLLAAKLMAELFVRINLPVVLGELLAGMIISPFALGMYMIGPTGEPLLQLTPEIKALGEFGALIILFMAGLEMTPKEFIRGGKASFTVGTLGVLVPFGLGILVLQLFGFDVYQSLLIATALTATSIAISIQVLNELGKIKTPEARLIIGAAVVDDVLAIALLSVVLSIGGSDISSIPIEDVVFTILSSLGYFAALLIAAIFIMPRITREGFWKGHGSVEIIATAALFIVAAVAGFLGLSPIIGAFAVGMGLSTARVFHRIERYTHKLALFFAPLFFAIIGAQVDLRAVDLNILVISAAIVAVAIGTKIVGCGLPAMMFLKSRARGMRVGIGMVSRGEVGLIVAGAGVSLGVLTADVYSTIIIMVAVTTIITPIWLRADYKRHSDTKIGNATGSVKKSTNK